MKRESVSASSSTRQSENPLTPAISAGRAWQTFWFGSAWSSRAITLQRAFIGILACLWFSSFFANLESWFGENGFLNTRMASMLVEFEQFSSWQMWSPLWWFDSLIWYQAWLGVGVLLSVLSALGVGGRWSAVTLWLVAIAWVHRMGWMLGPVEPALMTLLGYNILLKPKPLDSLGSIESQRPWSNLGMRLIQCHGWMLLAFGLLSQLASLIWWRGDGIWWLVALGRSNLFSLEDIQDRPLLVNGLTHWVIGIQMLALWLLCTRSAKRLGFLAGCFASLSMMLLWDQILYAMLILVYLLPACFSVNIGEELE